MAEFNPLPPEYKHPEEYPAPAPGIFPPPEEGSAGAAVQGGSERKRRTWSGKSALLLAAAGITLLGVFHTAPIKPAAAEPPAETVAAQPVTEPAPTQPAPTQPPPTVPDVPTDAERLVAAGTWKNSAESEWVHFNADFTGWWYDGTYFGRMTWREDADGGVSYEAGMAYLSPELKFNDAGTPEKEGNCLHSAHKSGSIGLYPDEDLFACPGLRFGGGTYLPDDTPIDASVMDGVLGKTNAELLSGTVWHATEISDLGIPVAPSLGGGKPQIYTDTVYAQSVDFASGTLRLATKNDGLLWHEDWSQTGPSIYGDAAPTLDVPLSLANGEERADALITVSVEISFGFFSDMHPGDVEYNNMHFLWGRQIGPYPTEIKLLITGSGVTLGIDCIDLYSDNYALLAQD